MKYILPTLLLLLAATSLLVAQQPVGIDLPLTLTSNTGDALTLRFGVDCAATDGIDAVFGEAEQPPFPPLDKFYAVWVGAPIGQSWGNGLSKDFRQADVSSGSITKTHQILWQGGTGTTTITVAWNLPAGVTGVLTDAITGSIFSVPMSGSGSTPVSSGFPGAKMVITYNAPTVNPGVITGSASGIGGAGATLNGKVNPNGKATTYTFEYGTTTSYGSSTSSTSAGTAGCLTDVSSVVSGLSPNTTYHFRIAATNAAGTVQGLDNTFTTSAASAPTVTTTAATSVTGTGAQLNGTVNPNGVATNYQFEYGLTTSYGTTTSSTSAGSGTSEVAASATLTGLAPNTLYHYRLVGTSAGGTTNGSDLTFTTSAVVPTVTTTAATSVTGTGVQLNGTVNPNGAATTYQFEYGLTTGYGSTSTSTSAGSGTSSGAASATLTGLTPNTTYHYRLNGTNSAGTSNGSDLTFTTGAVPPTVTTTAASGVTATGGQLNGTVNPNGAATDYHFEYGTTTSYGSTTATVSAGSGSADIPVNAAISSLVPNTTYHFRLVGTNSGGTTNGSDLSLTTTAVAPTVTTTGPTNVTGTGAQVNGTVNPNNAATTYQFEYGLTTAYGSTTTSTSAGSGTSAVPVNEVLTGLAPNTTYHYRLNGTNSAGTSNGSDQTFTTGAVPPTVTTLAASTVTSSGAQLNGTINPNGTATNYQFEYGTSTSYGSTTSSTSAGSGVADVAANAAISGLQPNTTYHYRLVGTNAGGTTNGLDATFITSAVAPTVTTTAATSVTPTGAQLNGTVNPNNAATNYQFEYGLTTSYGSTTSSTSAGSGGSNVAASAALTSLLPNTTYHYRLNGTNSAGTSNGSDLTFTTGVTAPTVTTTAATGVTTSAAQLNGTINPNGTASTYQFEYGTTTAYGTTTTSANAGSGSADVPVNAPLTGLNSNTTYHYRLVGTNAGGAANGADQSFTTGAVPPTVATGSATSVTATGAQLNGTVNPNNAATTYQFEYGTTTSYGSTTSSTSAGSGTSAASVNAALTGLIPSTTYHFRITATNAGGSVQGVDSTFTTSLAAPTVTTNAASSVTTTGAQLNGTVNPNNSATTYQFEYGLTTAYGSTTTSTSAGSGATGASVNATLTGLGLNTTYHFRLVATNAGGTTNGADQSFTTGAVAPTIVTNAATSVTTSGAQLNGSVNPNGTATTYQFEYGLTTAYGLTTTSTSAGSGTSAVPVNAAVSGLAPNTTYHFRLVGSNPGGGSNGADQTLTTGAIAPACTTLVATNATATSVQLNGAVNPNKAATTYQFEYGTTASYGSTTPSQDAGAGTSMVPVNASVTGLVANTTYHYRITATNAGGSAQGSDQTFTTTPNLPPTVATLGFTDLTQNTARVLGTVNPNGAPTTYFFEYGLTPSFGSATTAQSAGFGMADVSVDAQLNGLVKGTYYYYRLVGQNSAGTTNGDMKTLKTYSGIGGLIANGGFEDLSWPWQLSTDGTGTFTVGAPGPGPHVATVGVTAPGSIFALGQGSITLEAGALYRLRFKAYSSTGHDGAVSIFKETSPFTPYGLTNHVFNLDTDWKPFEVYFTASGFVGVVTDARFELSLAGFAVAGDQYFFDDVILEKITAAVAPLAVTSAATGVTTSGGQVNGSVTPNGTSTTYSFEYGTTTAYGSSTSAQNAGDGSSPVAVNSILSGLAPATTYHFRLIAQNAGGISQGSDQEFTTAANPPTVTTAAATGITTTGAQLNGTVNPNGVSTTYQFEYGTTIAYGSTTSSQNAGSGFSVVAVNALLTGLPPNTMYHYRLVAQNAGGSTQGSDQTFTTGALAPTVKTDAITDISTTGATVSGTINPNGVATSYIFEYGLTISYGASTTSQSAGTGSAPVAVNATLAGLTPNTLYHFRLVATSGGGTTQGRDSTFTTKATLPGVTVTAATGVHSTGAQLNGTVNPNGTAATYYFEYGTTTSYGTKTTTQNAGSGSSAVTVNALLTGLTKSTLYHYRLVAQNSGGTTTGSDMTFSTTATGVSTESGVPTVYDLSQNYPNPFNPTTLIRFALPKAAQVTLTLYSILGQPVAELVNDRLDVGYHVVEVNAAMLATGTYFYRLTAGEFVAVKRMAVVK